MQSNMLTHIRTENDLDAALAALTRADSRFGALLASSGRPSRRRRPDGFAGLASIVVSQQLSTASASAIWRPLRAIAARVLWTYYRAVKGRDGAPNLPKSSPKPKRGRSGR